MLRNARPEVPASMPEDYQLLMTRQVMLESTKICSRLPASIACAADAVMSAHTLLPPLPPQLLAGRAVGAPDARAGADMPRADDPRAARHQQLQQLISLRGTARHGTRVCGALLLPAAALSRRAALRPAALNEQHNA